MSAEIRNALHDTSGRVGIAYSGGVDSSVLALLTARAIGRERTILLLGQSASLAKREHRFAVRQARQLGLAVVPIETHELRDENYSANPVDRCYYCKNELFSQIDADVALTLNLNAVAYGENADDSRQLDRPGGRAAREHHVLYPLATAGATKADVRAIAQHFGLISADKPAAPCLASRIPHGEPVTEKKLQQVDEAEDAVLAAGFSDCRVRHHGTVARIELPADEISRLSDDKLRQVLTQAIKAAGFRHVCVDLAGIQSGAFTLSIISPGGRRG
ncbi:MAG: ATP-dependent sacrificial sulfur transferase LarE [Actinomycetaceae bacterium]|nr:ATP-dependent sacrificial sulfur transferase LarE [Actinomycetaceae bacterium]